MKNQHIKRAQQKIMKKAGAAEDDDKKDSRSLDTALDTDEMSGSTSGTSFCDKKRSEVSAVEPKDRFDRVAISEISIAQPIILTIHGITVDVSSWARAHPGGEAILRRFHNRDATHAFDAVGHSESARTTLQNFALITSRVGSRRRFGVCEVCGISCSPRISSAVKFHTKCRK